MTAAASRGFYGWRVVGTICRSLVYGGGLYAFTVFVPALTAEFLESRHDGWLVRFSG
jgi:hypothetical protein